MNIYKKILIEKCQIFWAYKNLPPIIHLNKIRCNTCIEANTCLNFAQ